MGGRGELWVNDVDESRLRQLWAAARRAGIEHMVKSMAGRQQALLLEQVRAGDE